MRIRRLTNGLILLLTLMLLSVATASATIGSSIPLDAPSYQWIQIPGWLAGTWLTKVQTYLDSLTKP